MRSSKPRLPVLEKVKPIVVREDGAIAPKESTEDEPQFYRGWQPVTQMIGNGFDESVRLGQTIGAIPTLCWQNAKQVVQKLDKYSLSEAFRSME